MKESKKSQESNEKIIFEIKEYIGGNLDSIYFMEVTPSEGDPYINYLNYELNYEKIENAELETIKIFRPEIPDMTTPEVILEPHIPDMTTPEVILEPHIPKKKFSSSFNIFIFTKIE